MVDVLEALPVFGLLLALFLAAGWLFARVRMRRSRSPVRGLNYLLNEDPDPVPDADDATVEVTEATLDGHLARASELRRRGDIDRALRLHQHLLARPVLHGPARARVELELARDYLAAGLLNRAESLLAVLVQRDDALRRAALEALLELHQRERNWAAAADAARELAAGGAADVSRTLAHHLCELGEEARRRSDLTTARQLLAGALEQDPRCVRASLLSARLEFAGGHYRDAAAACRRVHEQDPRFLPEVLPLLVAAHHELGTDRDLLHFLATAGVAAPAGARAGHDAASRTGAYACDACGFSGPVLQWQCPACKTWGSIAPQAGRAED
ncbi:MAG: hypothetical protein EA417_03860 [Gammaproteobacteria bacterium]|nr:MAG: hypothetical protein EA417_03860 [Gammaproteobacteria bacterium]